MSRLISYDIQDGHHIAMVSSKSIIKHLSSGKSRNLVGADIRTTWRFKIAKLIHSNCQHATLAAIMNFFKRQLQDYNNKSN